MYKVEVNEKQAAEDLKVMVVPCTLIEKVLYMYHNTVSNCHSGPDVSLEQCKKRFYFYKMSREFKLYAAACITCHKNKRPNKYLRAPLKPITASHFGQRIAVDHLEVSKTATPRGNVALLTIVDLYSGYLVCVPVRSLDTAHSIKAILHHWILKFGFAETIQHDLGSAFTSGLFQEVMKIFGIKDKKSTGYHSQTNGAAEIQNFRINQAMRVTLRDHQWKDYDLWIPYIVFSLNSLVSSRTGYSANFLAFGRELYMPRDLFLETDDRLERIQGTVSQSDHAKIQAYNLYKQIKEISRKVRDNSERRAKYMTKQYDKKVKGPFFEKGDLCFLLVNVPAHKYADKWTGPHRILEKINDWNYVIELKGSRKVISISKMRHYNPNKYTPPGHIGDDARSTAGNPAGPPPPTRKKRQRSESEDSSSDDDPFYLIPQFKRRSPRIAGKPPISATTYDNKENSEKSEKSATIIPESNVTPDNSFNKLKEDDENLTITKSADEDSSSVEDGEPVTPTPSETMNNGGNVSNLDSTATSDGDFADALENHDTTNKDSHNTPGPSGLNFQSIDNQDVRLADIEDHQKDKKIKSFLPSTGTLERTTTSPNLTPTRQQPSDTGNGVNRSSGHYNLRKNPKPRSPFKMPSFSRKTKKNK